MRPFARIISRVFISVLGAQPGTEAGPQWIKIPNLAFSYHSGVLRFAADALVPDVVFFIFAPPKPRESRTFETDLANG
jgi:hypothetical protein